MQTYTQPKINIYCSHKNEKSVIIDCASCQKIAISVSAYNASECGKLYALKTMQNDSDSASSSLLACTSERAYVTLDNRMTFKSSVNAWTRVWELSGSDDLQFKMFKLLVFFSHTLIIWYQKTLIHPLGSFWLPSCSLCVVFEGSALRDLSTWVWHRTGFEMLSADVWGKILICVRKLWEI